MSSTIQGGISAGFEQIEVPMNYLVDTGEKPVSYMYEPPAGVPSRTGKIVKHTIGVINGRPVAASLTLDDQGFMLTHHETSVHDFYDADEVRRIYYPEVERLVKEKTGATRVIVFDHNVRNGSKEARAKLGVREPVKFAHNDYTIKSGPQRVRDLMGDAEADELLKHRYAFINVWRPVRGAHRRSVVAQMLRLRRAPHPVYGSFGVRGSNLAAERGTARKYRGAHDSVLRARKLVTPVARRLAA